MKQMFEFDNQKYTCASDAVFLTIKKRFGNKYSLAQIKEILNYAKDIADTNIKNRFKTSLG